MDEPKKIVIGVVAVLAVLLAGFFAYKSFAPVDTNSGAQDEAKKMVQSRDQTNAIPKDQYAKLMHGMVGPHK
jgi:uncharacterized protein YxeA